MNSEIQKYILNFLIKMPLNRKKDKKSIYIYNPISEQFFNKLICCFPDCNINKNNLKLSNECILNSFDYYDLVILFNINVDIENKVKKFFDILSAKGEIWIICFPLSDIEKCVTKNIFDFTKKIPKIKNNNDEVIKETLEIVEMLLFPTKIESPISPKSKLLLNTQIDKAEEILYDIDTSKYIKSSSFVGNKIKLYVIKKRKNIS